MTRIEITENELLDALLRVAPTAPSGALSVKEWCKKRNCTEGQMRDALGRIAMMDRLEVHRVPRKALDGTMRVVPTYVILPPKKKGKP